MKCPRCGTTNGKTNRFCRGCGLQLGNPALQQAEQQGRASGEVDEVALGQELFEVWQVYSRGELDDALARTQKILRAMPESASAHSLLALIYERKAEDKLKNGEPEQANELLKLAVAEYERILELNPNSAADREKLSRLRMRIAGQESTVTPTQSSWPVAALRLVPVPLWVAFATFVIVLMAAIVLMPGGAEDKSTPARPIRSTRVSQTPKSGIGGEATGASQSRVYVFPSPSMTGYPMARPQTPPSFVSRPSLPKPTTTEPVKLPPILGANVKIVPETKSPAKKPAKEATKEASVTQAKPPEPEEKPSSRPEGDDAFARAVELYRQGATEEAIRAAEEAIRLYQADIDAGRNTENARRGQESARKLLQVLQEGR
ncbi:MAG: hypothetical protein N3B12_03770 [Armatimonadetes bacterium]|nr:hypothetical protein [Armatimonadota bacterium]